MSTRPLVPVLVGATASGKTELAIQAARQCDFTVEAIGLDSRQIYRELEVGTGKPSASERDQLTHHCVDFLDTSEGYDAGRYRRRVERTLPELWERGVVPLVVGGAGFYLRALREGFLELPEATDALAGLRASMEGDSLEELRDRLKASDPGSAERIHDNDRYRITRALEIHELTGRTLSEHRDAFVPTTVCEVEFSVVHLSPPRPLLHERIERRARAWLGGAWQGEVGSLLDAGHTPDEPGLGVLGYPEILQSLRGELAPAALQERIVVATRQYAKQQETWFRKEAAVARGGRDGGLLQALVAQLREAQRRLGPS